MALCCDIYIVFFYGIRFRVPNIVFIGLCLEPVAQLRLLVEAVVGREQMGCASGSGGGTVDDKVGGDDEGDARESSPLFGRRLRRGKVTGRRETGRKETRRK